MQLLHINVHLAVKELNHQTTVTHEHVGYMIVSTGTASEVHSTVTPHPLVGMISMAVDGNYKCFKLFNFSPKNTFLFACSASLSGGSRSKGSKDPPLGPTSYE